MARAALSSPSTPRPTLVGPAMVQAAACILVIMFHIGEHLASQGVKVWPVFRVTLGIDLFFVISGFMMAMWTKDGDTFAGFMIRRLGRIVPLYYVLTAAWIGLVSLRPGWFPHEDLSASAILAGFAFMPHFNAGGAVQPPLFVGWTINYFMWLYVIFALTLRLPMGGRVLATAAGVAALFGVALLFPKDSAFRDFFTDLQQFEFVGGVWLAYLLQKPAVISWVKRTSLLPIILLGLAISVGTMAYWSVYGLDETPLDIIMGIGALCIVFGMVGHEIYRRPLKPNLLSRVGALMYPMYLLHPFVIVLAVVVSARLSPYLPVHPALFAAFVYGVTIGLSWLSDRYFETPVNSLIRRAAPAKPRTPSSGGSLSGQGG